MNCECHDLPCYWQIDKLRPAGGRWECRVRRSEYSRRAYEKRGEAKRAAHRAWWHRADGGYIQWRKKDLAVQRAEVLARIDDINREVKSLESQP